MELQFQRRNITIKINYEDGIPKLDVDDRKVEQVVMNLLGNALKFAKNGSSVIIAVDSVNVNGQSATGSKAVQVSISDIGLGIPKDEIGLLFERYKQASSANKIKHKGTGLGLSICKLIVEAHGGTIRVESEPDQWTTFRFTLPIP